MGISTIVGRRESSDFICTTTLPLSDLAFKISVPFCLSILIISTREIPSTISKSAVTVLNNAFHPKEFKGTTETITFD